MKKIIFLLFFFVHMMHIQTIIAAHDEKIPQTHGERLTKYFQIDNIVDLLKYQTFQQINDAMHQEISYEKMDFQANQKIERKHPTWFSLAQECQSIKIIFILLLIQNKNPQISLSEFMLQIHSQVKVSDNFIIEKMQEAYFEIKNIMISSKEHNKTLVEQIKNNGHQTVINTITILCYQIMPPSRQYALLKTQIDLDAIDVLDSLLTIHCPEAINNDFFDYSESLLDYAIQNKKSDCIQILIKHGIKTINPTSYNHIFTTKTIDNDTEKYIPISYTRTHGDSPFDDDSLKIYNYLHEYKLNSWTPARSSALTLSAFASAFIDIYTFEKSKTTKEKKTKKNSPKLTQKPDMLEKIEKEIEVETKEKSEQKISRLKRLTTHVNEWRKDLWNHPRNHKKLLIPLVTILGLRLFKDSIPGLNSI